MEKVKFLVIDDNSDNLIVLKALLNEAFPNATFIGAQSGKKGIKLCLSEKPDVILLDIVMPEMDGYEVCKNLKSAETTKTIPIIMMTAAQTDTESRIKALEFGADAFLAKPVDESELVAQIRAMLRIKESEDRKLNERERLEALVSERTQQLENELKERIWTEDLLRVSEDKFKYIFDYSSVGKSITLTSGEINLNRAFYNILGYTQEELQHTKWQEITHPDDIDLTQRAIDSLLSGEQESARFVKRFIHKSGDIVWVDLSTSLRRDKDNKPLYFMTSIIDITERKQAEERLRESEMRLRNTFDQSPVGSVIVGLDNRFIRCNSAFCHFLGYSEDELIGKTYSDVTWPDDKELGLMDIKLIREGKKDTSTFQKRYLRKDGIIVWGEVSISMVRYADNNPLYFLTIIQDITEWKLADAKLRESESQFRELWGATVEGITIQDKGIIIEVNDAMCRMFGYDRDQVLGRSMLDFVPIEMQDQIRERIALSALGRFETPAFRADGTRIIIEVYSNQFSYQGKSVRMVATRDITERKQSEVKLQESESQFRELWKATVEGITILDNGIIVEVNDAMCQLLGYNREQVIGKSLLCFAPDEMHSLIRERIASGIMGRFETPALKADGTRILLEVFAKPFTYQGKVLRVVAVRDITERQQAEVALRESEQLFRGLFNVSPNAINLIDPHDPIISWPIVDCNGATCQMNGYTREELIGHSIDILNPTEGTPEERIAYFNHLKNEGVIHTEVVHRHKDGHFFPVEVSTSIVTLGGHELILGIDRDITERKQAEAALKESEQLFRGLFKASPDAIVLIDPHHPTISWPIVDCNEASCQINGYSREELIGHSIDVLNTTEGTPEERIDYFKKLKKEGIIHAEVLHRHKDGHFFPVEVATSIVSIGGHELILGIDRDITERKIAEEALIEINELNQSLLKTIPFGMDIVDEKGNILFQSENFEKIFGKDAVGRKCWELYCDEKKQCIDCPLDKGIEIGETDTNESTGVLGGKVFEINHTGMMFRGKKAMLEIFHDITERKKAEERIRESEERFRMVFENVFDGLVIYEEYPDISKRKLIDCNEQYAAMAGMTREEMLKYENTNNIQISLEEASNEVRIDALSTKKRFRGSYSWIRPDGKDNIIEFTGVPVMWRGKLCTFGIDRDITESKKAELALKESEERYSRFISQISEGVYRFECDEPMNLNLLLEEQIDFIYDHTFIAECNAAFLEMYGIKDEKEMIGKSHLDFHGGRNNPLNRSELREFISNGYRIENAITEEIKHNGQIVYFSNNSLGIIENNKLVRIWGTQTDITEKTRSDQVQQVLYTISNAALSSKDLPELLEVISLQVGKLLDSTNFFIAFYDEASGMLSAHYEKDEKDEINIWPADKSATGYVIKHQKSLLASEDDIKKLCDAGELEMVGTPSKVWLGVPLWVNKKIIGAIVVQSYDNPDAYTKKDQLMLEFISSQISISIERKKAEQEIKEALVKAQESDRLKSAFLANMSHEIRTPLNSIIGFSELLLDPDFGPDQHEEFIRMISASGNNLLAIINDIIDISKIESGLVSLTINFFSVHKFIGDIQKEYSFKAGEKGIDLRLDPSNPSDDLYLESDEPKLKQILINFVGNAIKFTEKGFIEIGFRINGNLVEFHVKDSGIGIPKEYHETIFERFRQVDSSYTRKYGGNGLGLAISKSLTELLGGKIWMESEKGEGSIFFITIPIPEKNN